MILNHSIFNNILTRFSASNTSFLNTLSNFSFANRSTECIPSVVKLEADQKNNNVQNFGGLFAHSIKRTVSKEILDRALNNDSSSRIAATPKFLQQKSFQNKNFDRNISDYQLVDRSYGRLDLVTVRTIEKVVGDIRQQNSS